MILLRLEIEKKIIELLETEAALCTDNKPEREKIAGLVTALLMETYTVRRRVTKARPRGTGR